MSLKTKITLYRVKHLTEALQTYTGKPARISGEPFATRLDKPYPLSALTRRALIQAVEMSNNAEMLGWGKADINGETARGIYFQATDGSAKGVAWQAGVNVYRVKQVGKDVFFANSSHIGAKVDRPRMVEGGDSKPLPPLHKWLIQIVKGKTVYTYKDFQVIEQGEPPGSGLYVYDLFIKGKPAGKFNNQREVVSKAQALRGK